MFGYKINLVTYCDSIFSINFVWIQSYEQLINKLSTSWKVFTTAATAWTLIYISYLPSLHSQWICPKDFFLSIKEKIICYLKLTFVLTVVTNPRAVLNYMVLNSEKGFYYRWIFPGRSNE
jgi:hypothetical protein